MLKESDDPYIQKALITCLCKFQDTGINELIKQYTEEEYSVIVRADAEDCLKQLWKQLPIWSKIA